MNEATILFVLFVFSSICCVTQETGGNNIVGYLYYDVGNCIHDCEYSDEDNLWEICLFSDIVSYKVLPINIDWVGYSFMYSLIQFIHISGLQIGPVFGIISQKSKMEELKLTNVDSMYLYFETAISQALYEHGVITI